MRRSCFTLLEVVIALVILSTFAIVCLEARLSSLRAGQQIAASQRIDNGVDAILDLAVNRMLPNPAVERDDSGRVTTVTWTGEHMGEAFTCVQDEIAVEAPIMRAGSGEASLRTVVRAARYTVTYAGRTETVVRLR